MSAMGIHELIAATAELCGAPISKPALAVMLDDLRGYSADQLVAALKRCRAEHKGRLTVEAIVSRIDDGRPGPEEAWAMIPRDEFASVVWSAEMAEAYGVAQPLLASGEPIPARMAFVEHYRAAVAKARASRIAPQWTVSLGFDARGREQALMDAAAKGRISQSHPMLLHTQAATAEAHAQTLPSTMAWTPSAEERKAASVSVRAMIEKIMVKS